MGAFFIAIVGSVLMFVIGAIYGAIRINRPKTLIYSLLISVGGFTVAIIVGNVVRILTGKNPDKLGLYGEILGFLLFGGFLCMPLGIGAIIAGSIRLIAKDRSLSRPKISE